MTNPAAEAPNPEKLLSNETTTGMSPPPIGMTPKTPSRSDSTIMAMTMATTTASALDAGKLMLDHDISAVVVEDEAGNLIGIVTERDLARRVVAAGHNGKDVSLEEVMTKEPARLRPDDSPFDALELMRDRRIRHVPLVNEGHVVGMVSIRDLRHASEDEFQCVASIDQPGMSGS